MKPRSTDELTKQEYEGKSDFSIDFMDKLQKWISQKKFKVTEEESGNRLVRVNNLFDFTLN